MVFLAPQPSFKESPTIKTMNYFSRSAKFITLFFVSSILIITFFSPEKKKSPSVYESRTYTVADNGDTLTKRLELSNIPDGSYAITAERNGIEKTVHTTVDCDRTNTSKDKSNR
jgi:hypothetical protein